VHSEINTEVDLEFEYEGEKLKFQMVPVSGSVDSGLATYWETSWCDVNLHIELTPDDVQKWVVEMFADDGRPVPPWAYTDGQAILDEMKERIEVHVDAG